MHQALGMWQALQVQYVLRVWQPLFLWCYGCVMSLADVSGTSCFGGVVSAWPLRPIILFIVRCVTTQPRAGCLQHFMYILKHTIDKSFQPLW